MGSLYLTSLADWLRAAGVSVVEYDGWQTRSRSSGGFDSGRPWGVMWHHTASSTSPQNDADYMCHGSSDKPIANLLVARDGAVWVLAAGATNTNGKGGPWSWSRGQVPQDSMNTYAVGMEIANNGVGEAYPQAQIDAAFAASVAIVQALGLNATDICNHYSYAPTRKIDPATASAVEGSWKPTSCTNSGTWDLDDLISEHSNRCNEPPPAPEEDDMDAPASLWLGGGRLDYFMVGTDRAVYHCWWDTGAGAWSAWENLGGTITSNLSVTGQGDNGRPVRIDVSGMGTDNNIWHRYFDSEGWAAWEPVSPQPPC